MKGREHKPRTCIYKLMPRAYLESSESQKSRWASGLREGPRSETGNTCLMNPEMAKYMLPTPRSFPGLLLDKAMVAFAGLGLEGSAESCLLRHLLFPSGHRPLSRTFGCSLQLSPTDPRVRALLEAEPGSPATSVPAHSQCFEVLSFLLLVTPTSSNMAPWLLQHVGRKLRTHTHS